MRRCVNTVGCGRALCCLSLLLCSPSVAVVVVDGVGPARQCVLDLLCVWVVQKTGERLPVERFDAAAKHDEDEEAAEAKKPNNNDGEPVATANDKIAWVFHLIMFFAALYLAMLVSNWGMLSEYVTSHQRACRTCRAGLFPLDWCRSVARRDVFCRSASPSSSPEEGRISMWVKIASQWLVYILFYWIMLAPVCFPDRDFS